MFLYIFSLVYGVSGYGSVNVYLFTRCGLQMFFQIAVCFLNLAEFAGKHLRQSLFFNKVGTSGLELH